ncbi:uncharacterized protein LOC117107623 [Anneissia japonica]|uniref:uncharacterized protein LOC117107623 n=1 Tax=Anneissia japonica TaxID=1529436 RepID=UPI00142550DB|nr:uncharacterized protein LOC117107623 [Anneissia japonica]
MVDPIEGTLGESSLPPSRPRPRQPETSSLDNFYSSETESTTADAFAIIQQQSLAEISGPICVVCTKECGSHKRFEYRRPVHIIPPCLGEGPSVIEEGYGVDVRCAICFDGALSDTSTPSKRRLESDESYNDDASMPTTLRPEADIINIADKGAVSDAEQTPIKRCKCWVLFMMGITSFSILHTYVVAVEN